jgi:geranylgeranyl diphosphate synthase, type I
MTTSPVVLARANILVEPELRKVIASLDPNLRTPVEYHFGWVERDGTPRGGSSGKGVRPALAVLGAEAVGAEAQAAVPGAVALELIHNFSLIHDDIMDGDRTRRHRRTVWDVYGVGDAIIIGDALHTLAFEILLADAEPLQVAAARRLAAATSAMIAGQAQDSALDRSPRASLSDCITMQSNKTGALLAQSVAIGAVLGGGSDHAVACLERYGAELGLSFQAVDDLLGIWGDPDVTGKPVGSDLRSRKKSLPVALAYGVGGALADEFVSAFDGEITDDVVRRLSDDLTTAGIRDQVVARARSHLEAALDALQRAELDPASTAELAVLARFVVDRTF